MELGLYTFGDLVRHPKTGKSVSATERMRQMLEMAVIADEAGLDILGVGEHHGLKFVNSATATTLSAMAAITKRIRLTSATTLLSTADPVRTFQEFATADLVSEGRIELIFGRGAFTDNFSLFGFDTKDYDALFMEKLKLFEQLNTSEQVSWQGRFRAPLDHAEIAPRPAQPKLPVWIGAGSPASVARAASMGYPVAIPVLGGSLPGYAQTANLYQQTWEQSGYARQDLRLAVFSHLHVTGTSQETVNDFYPYYSAYLEPLYKQAMPKAHYHSMLSPYGSLIAGSPQQVIDKLLYLKENMGLTRYVGQIDIGGQDFTDVIKGVELFAGKVVPVIRSN
ncbi:Flavin-dependent oxidoreductase, luciferase family (includes alkanesulfonate monooxygenase SsuD and methylene tetrahydromethanopterin reductase) [Mucilaginibacter pineti]|uniref:Flavin-dependent oxidoreductase, luciferase family (Includes alkanesulfonate monooxygenase SsuD and methylene tetrahydromethanopterin reductase) n=1 Tax=Mucilaginibacter pineti TaxID=1391627 RepID=A0A1G7LJS3_9SPHI|nr:LLM class flavin-dependent oxidoreductase [Mucilaginibacter pineti]SDF49767.1 Flavin-dependent oxidoreductase, luciferase family (includes alkanesulfonate monooxygenase SsuD and methylene tetrahydromethanopterin reductase) [Mucilaginibacter pineti]